MKTGEKTKKNLNESKLLIAIKIIPTIPKAAMVALNKIKIIPSGDVDYSDHFGTFSWLWRLKILDVLIHGKNIYYFNNFSNLNEKTGANNHQYKLQQSLISHRVYCLSLNAIYTGSILNINGFASQSG